MLTKKHSCVCVCVRACAGINIQTDGENKDGQIGKKKNTQALQLIMLSNGPHFLSGIQSVNTCEDRLQKKTEHGDYRHQRANDVT